MKSHFCLQSSIIQFSVDARSLDRQLIERDWMVNPEGSASKVTARRILERKLQEGTYTVSEIAPTKWLLLVCSNRD